MEIFSNPYFSVANSQKIRFKGDEHDKPQVSNDIADKYVSSIEYAPIVPDFKISTPIKYNFIEDVELPNGLKGKFYKLANGQRIVIVPKKGPTVIKTYVNTGSMNEPDNLRGISHFIEHNLFNGSETLGDKVFFDEVHKLGANTNASTSFAQTDYYIDTGILSKGDLEKEIELHAGMLQSPKFLTEKLEKEKNIVNSEINMCLSKNENIGYSNTVKNLFNIKTNSNDLVAGTTDNIINITREDVVNYFNDNYYPSNMVTVVTGDVDDKETIDLISKYFNSSRVPQKPRHFEELKPIDAPVRNDIISSKTDDGISQIFIGFAGPKNQDYAESVKIDALQTLLSRLNLARFSAIEKKHNIMIAMVEDRIGTRPNDNSMIMLATETLETDSEEVLHQMYYVLDDIVKNPPNEAEMEAIKNYLKKGNEQILETSHGINCALGEAFMNGNGELLKNYNKIVDNLTAEDLVETAKKYLDLNKASITVIHPKNASKSSIMNNYRMQEINVEPKVKRVDTSKISQLQLNNNIRVVLNDTNSNNMQCDFTLRNFDFETKNKQAINVLSYILDNEGTKSLTDKEIAAVSDRYGIEHGLGAESGAIGGYMTFPKDNLKSALKLLNDRVQNPQITDETVNTAKVKLLKLYMNSEEEPLDDYFSELFPDNPRYTTKKEQLESLIKLSTNDVVDCYNSIKNNGQAVVTISGPFSKYPELKDEVIKSFSTYDNVQPLNPKLKKDFKPVDSTKVLTLPCLKNQAQILEGFKFNYNGNVKDYVSVMLLNNILGGSSSSRLFTDLREQRHLAYAVNSKVTAGETESAAITLNIKTTTQNIETGENSFENVQKSIDGFNENIKKLLKDGITQEELDLAKKNYKAELLSVESSSHKNLIIHDSMGTPYGVNFENEKLKALESITVKDINNAIQNIFNSKPIYSITATKETLDYNKDYFESLKD